MTTTIGSVLRDPRTARFAGLTLLLYFAAEWVVSASWRGQYGYRAIPTGPLGIEFCGPRGNWPCSALYPVMNVGFAVTGGAIAVLAVTWLARRAIPVAGGVALILSGAGLLIAGIITQRVDYDAHVAAMSVFYVFGALGVLFIGASDATGLSVPARAALIMGGALATVAYFAFVSGITGWLGDGGTERAIIYPILISLLVAGVIGGNHGGYRVASAASATDEPATDDASGATDEPELAASRNPA